MHGPTDSAPWHSCAGCRKPVDAHRALKLRSAASWLCRTCAQAVAKELVARAQRPTALGPMQPTFD